MIRNIWAVGRNYADHAVEMKASLPQSPLIFLKAGSCVTEDTSITLPSWSTEIHHEIELALKLNDQLEFSHWGLALDLTERKIQSEAKKSGVPWTLAKSFTGACPLSPLHPFTDFAELENLEIELMVNGESRQRSALNQMIFKPRVLLEFIKTHFPVQPGDLILTGTPAGVAAVKPGDHLEASLGSVKQIWKIN
ncbi:MAG: fumarylacetoacetate hydrolase family protein [Bdellovibrionota bacterium]